MKGVKFKWIKGVFFLFLFFTTKHKFLDSMIKKAWLNIYHIPLILLDKKPNQVSKFFPKCSTCPKVLTVTNGGQSVSNRNLVTKQGHTHACISAYTQTSGGAEVFAGRSEAAGPVDIDCSNSELVPSAGSDVGQLDTLLCSLRDRWGGGEQTAGVRVHTGSQPHVSLLPHQSSVCFSLPNFQRHCDSEECATVCNGPSAQCNTFTAVACGTLGHVIPNISSKESLPSQQHLMSKDKIFSPAALVFCPYGVLIPTCATVCQSVASSSLGWMP